MVNVNQYNRKTIITRKSLRLRDYDYSLPGGYFVTICVQHRENVFGEIINEEMRLNEIGRIVQQCWQEIPNHFGNVELDAFVIMPNHIHGIIIINERDLIHQIPNNKPNHPDVMNPDVMNHVPTEWQLMKNPRLTLGKIVRYFKARSSKFIHDAGYDKFKWQSRFYEHIIRDDKALSNIRDYIGGNVIKWASDTENTVKNAAPSI
jgi:REP element-mobilizing transposase RayT